MLFLVRLSYYALALGWAVILLVLTLLPAPVLPPAPQWDVFTFDSLVHAILFGAQLLLLLFGFRRDPSLTMTNKLVTVSFVAVVLFGILVEVLQGVMGLGREMDPGDALSNAIGCVFGWVAWVFFIRRS